jgi:nucleoside recognition membrane protein YjiH
LAGGVITIFSSFLAVLEASGAGRWLAKPVSLALRFWGFDPRAGEALFRGIFEVTLGIEALAGVQAPLLHRAVLASTLAGWGGLSVLAQVAALVHGTDLSLGPYLLARFLHALFSGGLFLLFWG